MQKRYYKPLSDGKGGFHCPYCGEIVGKRRMFLHFKAKHQEFKLIKQRKETPKYSCGVIRCQICRQVITGGYNIVVAHYKREHPDILAKTAPVAPVAITSDPMYVANLIGELNAKLKTEMEKNKWIPALMKENSELKTKLKEKNALTVNLYAQIQTAQELLLKRD